jgi:hypothetical protein
VQALQALAGLTIFEGRLQKLTKTFSIIEYGWQTLLAKQAIGFLNRAADNDADGDS